MGHLVWPVILLTLAGSAAAAQPSSGRSSARGTIAAPAPSPVRPAAPDVLAACRAATGDAVIGSCTTAITAGTLKGHDLALAFDKRGVEHDRKGDLDEAVADFSEALQLDPKMAPAWRHRGLSYRRKREFDRSIADYTAAIKLEPNQAASLSGRAFVLADKGDTDAALADAEQALRINPRAAFTHAARGAAYRARGDYDRSIADYDDAIQLDPNTPTLYVNRGMAWRGKGDLDRAMADYDQALRLDPKDAAAHRERGIVLAQTEDFDHALSELNTAISLAPNLPFNFIERGRTYLFKGDNARAIADATRALEINPNSGVALNLRGTALSRMNEFDRAFADFELAARLIPSSAVLHANRGDTYRLKGLIKDSITEFTEALRIDPGLTLAYANRGLAYEAEGDLERARADFAAALDHPRERNIIVRSAVEKARVRLAAIGVVTPNVSPPSGSSPANSPSSAPQVPTASLAGTPTVVATATPGDTKSSARPVVAGLPAEQRVALVIGNSGYASVPILPNARRDAAAVAAALRNAGFSTVIVDNDLSREKLTAALASFARVAEKADWALVYYAGHGLELNGVNYLVPVDAKLESDRDVQFEALPLDQFVVATEGARKLRVILLDACRENPFVQQMRRTATARSIGRGLARIEPEGGTIIAYAAKHGEVALDGDGANSPFVTALVKYLGTPGIEISKLFRLVRDDVLVATNNRQEPFVYGSLPGDDFYFRPPLAKQ